MIELAGIETGVYGVFFTLNERYPAEGVRDADFLTSAPVRAMGLLHDRETVSREVPMYAAVELTAPPAVVPEVRAARRRGLPILHSPVRIAWKPVRGAVRYRVVLETPGVDGESGERRETESTEPSWTAELPPTPPDFAYHIIVRAFGRRAQVGETLVHFGVERLDAPTSGY